MVVLNLFLQQLKQQIHARKKPARGAAASVTGTQSALQGQLPLKKSMPSDWHRFFEGKFHGFSISHQHSIETFYESAWSRLPLYAADWRIDR